jgi:hypothetical protein
MSRTTIRIAFALVLACALAACTKPDRRAAAAADQATQLQRDSAIARMSIPGAKSVDRALGLVETSQDRVAAFDSIN